MCRDFSAEQIDQKWVGDFKQIDTDEGLVFPEPSRACSHGHLLGSALSGRHPTARLGQAAVNMIGVIFYTDKGIQVHLGNLRRGLGSARDPPIHETDRLVAVPISAGRRQVGPEWG